MRRRGREHSQDRASYREGLSFGALSFSAMALLGIVSTIATARAYGIGVIGEFALVSAPVNAAWFLSTVKERPAFVRELSKLPPRAPRVTALFWAVSSFSLALTAVVAGLALLATYFLFRGPIGQPELFVPTVVNMLGYVLITNTCFNYDTVFSGFRAGRQLFWIRLHQSLAFIAVALLATMVWDNVWGLVAATTISWGTTLLHRLVSIRPFMATFCSRDELRSGFKALPDMLRFGLKIAPGGIADGVSNEAGTWILGITAPVATLGAYNRAWQLGRRFLELNFRITEMLFPTLVERLEKGDHVGFDRALVDTIRYSAAGMLMPAAAGGGAAYGVMTVFGPGFSTVADALAIVLLMPALSTVSSIQRHTLYAVNRPLTTTWSAFVRMTVTLGSSVPLTLWLGPTGTALAVVLGFVADSSFMFRITRGHLQSPLRKLWPVRQMAAIALAYAAGFGAARGTYDVLPTYPGLALALIAGLAAYAVVFVAVGGVGSRDRERIASLRADAARHRRTRSTPVAPAEAGRGL